MQPLYDQIDEELRNQESLEEIQIKVNKYTEEMNGYCDQLQSEIDKRDKKIELLNEKIKDLKFENLKLETKLEICYSTILNENGKKINEAIKVITRDKIE
jgi:hypothetical protein